MSDAELVEKYRRLCGYIARHFVDMEAVYTYEGTNEVNTLVVGREITGIQAFA